MSQTFRPHACPPDPTQHTQPYHGPCWGIRRIRHLILRLVRASDPRSGPSPLPFYLAVLIDGENTPPDAIDTILAEVSRFGIARDRRVYGNWGHPAMGCWREPCLHYGLHQVHTVPARAGKNATDIALVVDALSLVERGGLHGVCLVASDSDYTPFVTHLRARGYFVLGIGLASTPAPLIQACTVHRMLDQPGKTTESGAGAMSASPVQRNGSASAMQPTRSDNSPGVCPPATQRNGTAPTAQQALASDSTRNVAMTTQPNGKVPTQHSVTPVSSLAAAAPGQQNGHPRAAAPCGSTASIPSASLRDLLIAAWQHAPKKGAWLSMAVLGSQMRQLAPTFSSSHYGYAKLSHLVQAQTDLFEVRPQGSGQYEVRLRTPSGLS